MKAGFFETDITPPYGVERAGSYGKIFICSVLTPLKVRAGVFDNGSTKVAFAGVDCCFIDKTACDAAKQIIEETCGITPANVMIGASHTHSGGAVTAMLDSDLLKDAPEDIIELAMNQSPSATDFYRKHVIQQIATAVISADMNKEDALLNFGSGEESRYVFNRRLKMKNGRCYTHPGACNPDIVEPAGPIDPEVGVLGAWRKDGTLLGCIVNYACHGTIISGANASADWIHYMQDTVRKVMGEKAVAVFMNGACGDITQVDNRSHAPTGGKELACRMGSRVGAEAVKVLNDSLPAEYEKIEAKLKVLKIKRRPLSPENLEESLKIVAARKPDDPPNATYTFAKEKVIYNYVYSKSNVVDVPVQAIQVGKALFVSNPSEFFCQLGFDIKNGSPMKYTWVVSLANGSVGYVPTPESFTQAGGGYETVLSSYSNLQTDAGTMIVNAALELANDAKAEELPPEEPAKQPGIPWVYGVLGPDLD